MVSIQNQYSRLFTNYSPIGQPAKISGPGTNDTQNRFDQVLELQKSQNGSVAIGTQPSTQADLDEYYSGAPYYPAELLKTAPFLLPNAETIQSIVDHASAKIQDLLEANNIPEAPERIKYTSSGEMVLPNNYLYKDAFLEALEDNPGLERELRDLNALSSHYAGIQRALANNSSSGYQKVTLTIGPEGAISVQGDGENLFASSDTASATEAITRESVVINGWKVIVSGHDLDEMEGRSLFRTVEGESTQSFQTFADQEMNSGEHSYENGILMLEGQPEMTVSTTRLSETARYGYTNVEYFNAGGETGLGAFKPGTEDESYRRLVAEYMGVVDVERNLKEIYGEDIKLIYSHFDGCHIMLTPDDARYDEMASAEEAVQTLLNNIREGLINRSAVEDLLAARGYAV